MKTIRFLVTLGFFLSVLTSCNNQSSKVHQEFDTEAQNFNDSVLLYVRSAPLLERSSWTGRPFDSIHFDRVIAYEFDGRKKENSRIIDSHGSFVKTIRKQKYLTADQVGNITNCLSDTLSYGEGIRPCFAPSEALVFFKDTTPVMTIDICLDCNFLESSIPIPARNFRWINTGDHMIPGIGFSSKGQQCIIDLSKQLGFVYGSFEPSN